MNPSIFRGYNALRRHELRWMRGHAIRCIGHATADGPSKAYTFRLFHFGGVAMAAVLVYAVAYGPSTTEGGNVLNKSTFTPFTITSKEQISPTAFILAVRPASSPLTSCAAIAAAWRHGLWSVEIKQPQLQIARHYTPLPPAPSLPSPDPSALSPRAEETRNEQWLEEKAEEEEDLRFLIRRTDGGEMSSYLSKRRPGDTIWLRGPHLGFDIAQRLGPGGSGELVFLAGGTGVAPALQIAARLLSSPDPPARISLLWANRRSADAPGRSPISAPPPSRWFALWSRADPEPTTTAAAAAAAASPPSSSSLAQHILALQRAHPGRFRVSYYVDEEGSFIGARDLEAACRSTSTSTSTSTSPSTSTTTTSCPWHSPASLPDATDEDDAAGARGNCACAETKNLLCVSGPDGFVAAYAGAKKWRDGRETQGVVGGLAGSMRRKGGGGGGGGFDDWLVLKL